MKHDTIALLCTVAIATILTVMSLTSSRLCQSGFSDFWSSTVVNDCFGPFWGPTGFLTDAEDRPRVRYSYDE